MLRVYPQSIRRCNGWPLKGRQYKPRDGCKAASGYALQSFTAIAIQSIESGQSTCYQTGQFYLLPTRHHSRWAARKARRSHNYRAVRSAAEWASSEPVSLSVQLIQLSQKRTALRVDPPSWWRSANHMEPVQTPCGQWRPDRHQPSAGAIRLPLAPGSTTAGACQYQPRLIAVITTQTQAQAVPQLGTEDLDTPVSRWTGEHHGTGVWLWLGYELYSPKPAFKHLSQTTPCSNIDKVSQPVSRSLPF